MVLLGMTGCDVSPDSASATAPSSQPSPGKTSVLEDRGEYWVLEGDILLSKEDEGHREIAASLEASNDGSPISARTQGVSETNPVRSWPAGNVSYVLSGSNWTTGEKNFMRAQMAKFTEFANITWTERTTTGSYVLKITKEPLVNNSCGVGGAASLGYVSNASFSLAADLTYDSMTIVHELAHVLGFSHEHSRSERDQFINIYTSNIVTNLQSHFTTKFTSAIPYTGYDVFSVLHYKSYSAAPSGCSAVDATRPMLLRKDGASILNRKLSTLDRQMVAMVYGAKGPVARTSADATRISTYTSNLPSDVAVSSTDYYLLRGTTIHRMSRSTGAQVSTKTGSYSSIDYVNSTYGVVAASNTNRQVYVNVFGTPKTLAYPAGVTSIRSISSYVSGTEQRIILAIPGQNYGATLTEYKVSGTSLVATGKTFGTGYYQATDLATDGSTMVTSSSYYFTTLSRLDWAAGTTKKEVLPKTYFTSHSYLDPVAYTWPEVRPSKLDAGSFGGKWGIFSLESGTNKKHLVFTPVLF